MAVGRVLISLAFVIYCNEIKYEIPVRHISTEICDTLCIRMRLLIIAAMCWESRLKRILAFND